MGSGDSLDGQGDLIGSEPFLGQTGRRWAENFNFSHPGERQVLLGEVGLQGDPSTVKSFVGLVDIILTQLRMHFFNTNCTDSNQ